MTAWNYMFTAAMLNSLDKPISTTFWGAAMHSGGVGMITVNRNNIIGLQSKGYGAENGCKVIGSVHKEYRLSAFM